MDKQAFWIIGNLPWVLRMNGLEHREVKLTKSEASTKTLILVLLVDFETNNET